MLLTCLLRDPRLANQVRHWNPYLSLRQDGHDLFHRIALPFTANLLPWFFDFAGNSLSDWLKNPGAAHLRQL